jgi:DNA gyrase subunit A
MVVTLSHTGYIKSQPLSEYRAQKRGGRGKQATATKEDDWIDQLFIANTHDYILCFSNRGRMYWLKVWEVPQARAIRAAPHRQHVPAAEGEKINVVLPLTGDTAASPRSLRLHGHQHGHRQEDRADRVQQPAQGRHHCRQPGRWRLPDRRALTDGKHDVMLFSDGGKAVRFDENDVRPMGRNARGVRGMMLEDGQGVIAMLGGRG